MINRILAATASFLLCTGGAQAADVAPAVSDWTGFYVGVNGGYGGGTFDFPMNVNANIGDYALDYDFGAEITASGFFGGLQAGYNWQMDRMVLGIEGDVSVSNVEGKLELSSDTANASISGNAEVDWFGTARLRAGYAATSSLLVYATGGLAWGSVTSGYHADLGSLGNFNDSTTNSQMGWALGGGVEYAITDQLSFKTEYLYVDLGSQKAMNEDLAAAVGASDQGSAVLTIHQDIAIQTVKAGINYRF